MVTFTEHQTNYIGPKRDPSAAFKKLSWSGVCIVERRV